MMGEDQNRVPPTPAGGALGADAVCAQCGTVNNEGSFICRACGNNLRDQRALRMAADQELERDGDPVERRRVLLGLLTAFGILAVLAAALHVNSIADWLIAAQASTVASDADLWNGQDAGDFAEMRQMLLDATPDLQAQEAAIAEAVATGSPEGLYVIAQQHPIAGTKPVGTALVRRGVEGWRFLALLNGGAEVRGLGRAQGGSLLAEWETASMMTQGDTFAVSGVALERPDGSFECFGQSAFSEQGYDFSAYHLAPGETL